MDDDGSNKEPMQEFLYLYWEEQKKKKQKSFLYAEYFIILALSLR